MVAKCEEHSGVCEKLSNLEQDMRNNVKKVNMLIYLAVANLAGIVVSLLIYIMKNI